MCRITGILSISNSSIRNDDLISMRDTMIEGGPDSCGTWIDSEKRIGLGHRRLSILDLSDAGHQPMHTPDGRYTVCYNGEIYNFRDIRKELTLQGVKFKSDCDTEVLLHAFANEGISCLNRFHGMFAFAIWDRQEKKLTLARDRIGVKPLYYALQNGLFLFGSELKSIMTHPKFERKLSSQALQLFLEYSYIPHPYSILEDAYKLGPGQWLQIDSNGQLQRGTWWSIENSLTDDFDWSDYSAIEEELETRMINSFERRMVSDVPVGVFLSGGIDSSLLLSLLSQKTSEKIKTFTIGFNEEEYNEAHYAKKVATSLGSEHHELYLDPDQGLDIIEKLPFIWDEPFGDNSSIATYLVSQFASKHVKVALSADGGDELFCGYPKYWLTADRVSSLKKHPLLCKTISKTPSYLLEALGRKASGNKLLKIKDLTNSSGPLDRNAFIYGQHVFSNYQLERLINVTEHSNWLPQMSMWENLKYDNPISKMMAIDLASYHSDDIHVKVDRASMANSLEAREPFLDHEIIEFALNIPMNLKLPNQAAASSKKILRNILYKYIDPSLIERPKMGFGVPLDHWLNNQLKSLTDTLLAPERLEKEGIFDPQYVSQLRQSFSKHPKRELNKIWNLVVFQMWKEKWL